MNDDGSAEMRWPSCSDEVWTTAAYKCCGMTDSAYNGDHGLVGELTTPKDTSYHPLEGDRPTSNDICAHLVRSHGKKEKMDVDTEAPPSCESNLELWSRDAHAELVRKTCTGNKSPPDFVGMTAVEATDNIMLWGCMACPSYDRGYDEPSSDSPVPGELLTFHHTSEGCGVIYVMRDDSIDP